MKIVKFRIGNLTETTLYFDDNKPTKTAEQALDDIYNKLDKVTSEIDKLEDKITEDFMEKAPKKVIEKVYSKINDLLEEENNLLKELNDTYTIIFEWRKNG